MIPPPPIPPPTGEMYKTATPTGLRATAAAQKLLLWSIVGTLIVFAVPPLALLAWAFQIYAIWNMSKTLELPNAWLWVIGTMIPLFGLLVLLRMNAKATTLLEQAGVRVGLMGANLKNLPP